jgi:hypothetical protein
MKQIQLTQGKVALVDDEDFEWLSKWKWYACSKNNDRNVVKWYARRLEGRKHVYMHREIMKTPKGQVVDHDPDPSGLNNQKANLTNVTENHNLRYCRFRKQYATSEPCL